jgi:uncharacterized protein (DUF1778 family)
LSPRTAEFNSFSDIILDSTLVMLGSSEDSELAVALDEPKGSGDNADGN